MKYTCDVRSYIPIDDMPRITNIPIKHSCNLTRLDQIGQFYKGLKFFIVRFYWNSFKISNQSLKLSAGYSLKIVTIANTSFVNEWVSVIQNSAFYDNIIKWPCHSANQIVKVLTSRLECDHAAWLAVKAYSVSKLCLV